MKSKSCRFAILFSIISLVGSAIFLAGCSDFAKPAIASTPEGYLFCFWNVENFFDDQEDDRLHGPDREYDRWYANDPAVLKLKLAHLSEALIDMNGGRGPDIIALAEVERSTSFVASRKDERTTALLRGKIWPRPLE